MCPSKHQGQLLTANIPCAILVSHLLINFSNLSNTFHMKYNSR